MKRPQNPSFFIFATDAAPEALFNTVSLRNLMRMRLFDSLPNPEMQGFG